MIRTAYVLLAALFAAVVIHIIVIMAVPHMAVNDVWNRSIRSSELGQLHVIGSPEDNTKSFPELDPAFAYAMCRLDISQAPAQLTGTLDGGFWSLAYFDMKNRVQFSLTNQISGSDVQVVLANKAQQRVLADRRDLVDDTAVIITAQENQGLLVLRAFVEQEMERATIVDALSKLDCSALWTEPSDQ